MDKKNTQNKKLSIDPAIPEKALKIIRTIGKGNGLKPEQVSFVDFSGETVTAKAQTIITLQPLVTKKTLAGRDSGGKVVESEQALNKAVTTSSELLSQDKDITKKIKDMILEREDQGFAMKGHRQKFHEFKKQFALHLPCQNCHANGKTQCQNCRGIGKTTCPTCRGAKLTQCINCNGTRVTQTAKGQIQCIKCQGQGRIQCTICRAHGQTQCRICNATGKMRCQACVASGWMTKSVMVEQEGVFTFNVSRETIDKELADLIEKKGANLLLKHDLEADIVELTETEEASLKPEQIAIGYALRMPYGKLTFQLKNKTLSSTLMGYQGRLINPPAFLEKLTKKHLMLLKKAADAPSTHTESLLGKACKARIIRDILKISAEHNQKNALKALLKKYPYGVQEKTFKSMIGYARKSFLDLTRSGRYKGLALGIGSAGLVTLLYYFALRPMVVASIPQTPISVALADGVAFLIGFGSNLFCVQLIGKSDLSKSLHTLLKKQVNVRATQVKTGSTWIWSLLGNILLFAGLSWIALAMGFIAESPMWLSFLK